MKWNNRGHQLDDVGRKYMAVKKLYLLDTDDKARDICKFLKWLGLENNFEITSFANDMMTVRQKLGLIRRSFRGNSGMIRESSGMTFSSVMKSVLGFHRTNPNSENGQAVHLSKLEKSLPQNRDEAIVVLPSYSSSKKKILPFLQQLGVSNVFYSGISHNRRDNFIQNFLCVYLMYKKGKLLSHWTNYLPTLRCTLNCKCCLNFNSFLKNPKDVSFADFKDHMDTLFSKFDYLYSLHFTGGEPQLSPYLPEMISYIADNYRDKIYDFFFITNGTIIPSEKTIEALRRIDGHVFIDDYSKNVKISRVGEIVDTLKRNGIACSASVAPYWYDLGITTDGGGGYEESDEEKLERHKDECNSFLHEFGEKRIYACCYQVYAHRAGLCELDPENDYIDIASTSKMEILEFRQGYTKKGYVDFCRRCRGIGCDAKKIDVAVQIPRNSKGQ